MPELGLFTSLLREQLAAGGKRLRPAMCVAGWQAVSTERAPSLVWRMAASLELFHTFALVHDDIMDRSVLRRGRPTAHRTLAALHAGRPDAESLGVSTAILLGDLALGWSYELLQSPGLPSGQLAAVWPVLNALRTETLVGQYLDLVATGRHSDDAAAARRAILYKTAKYTVERPLQLGALLAGATPGQLRTLSAYALPLGEAFQLRDDLLGAFGSTARTGKPALDDLREGKHTVLTATALQLADSAQLAVLQQHLGNPHLDEDGADQIRTVLTDTGAVATVEQMITDQHARAARALDDAGFHPAAMAVLLGLAAAASTRAT
ncbi:polyprenyl synthetase family protein [Streptomyces sp. ICC1]|nr:polyprenyl synthetase family protein [Streptomyces sp. ICC4]AWZ14377.1 polyprenyl synthetase family protein [Streptomyces sp. ICC1]